jgi:hypothetical protein
MKNHTSLNKVESEKKGDILLKRISIIISLIGVVFVVAGAHYSQNHEINSNRKDIHIIQNQIDCLTAIREDVAVIKSVQQAMKEDITEIKDKID